MDSTLVDWLLVLVGVVLTAGTAIFVAAEFSLVALDPAQLETDGDQHRNQRVQRALKKLSTQLSGAQVGITLTTILLGYTTQKAIARLVVDALGSTSLALAATTAIGATVALIITNAFSMLFGELVPKNLALANPVAAARWVMPIQMGFTWLFKPLVVVLNGSANKLTRLFGVEPVEEISGARSARELDALVRRSAEVGSLDTTTARIFTRSINISELTAIDVMTDRQRLHYLEEDASAADVVELARKTGHSRFPVIGRDLDDILGLVNLRRAVAVPYEKRHEVVVTSSSLMSPPPRVPETMDLAPLLVQLREEGLQMAVVVDEYGGTSGIVTLEDAVEEIVGEVADEHDARRAGIQMVTPQKWLVPGVLRPDELLLRTGLNVPDDGPYETLGGLVMAELARIPEVGDRVVVDEVALQVVKMDGMRIDRLEVEGLAAPEEEGGDE